MTNVLASFFKKENSFIKPKAYKEQHDTVVSLKPSYDNLMGQTLKKERVPHTS